MEYNLAKLDVCTQSLTILRDFANEGALLACLTVLQFAHARTCAAIDEASFAEACARVAPELIVWRVMNCMKAHPTEDHIQHHACLTIAALAKHGAPPCTSADARCHALHTCAAIMNKTLGRLGSVALLFRVATDVARFPFETTQGAVWAIVEMAKLGMCLAVCDGPSSARRVTDANLVRMAAANGRLVFNELSTRFPPAVCRAALTCAAGV